MASATLSIANHEIPTGKKSYHTVSSSSSSFGIQETKFLVSVN